MNESFLEALTQWQGKGRREFTVKVSSLNYNNETVATVTCYDADNGVFFYPTDAEAVTSVNIYDERKRSLRETIDRCANELSALEEMADAA